MTTTPDAAPEGFDDWTADAVFYEYSAAADPVRGGSTSAVPVEKYGADVYAGPGSRVIPLDLSDALHTDYPATSPALLASFVRVDAGEPLTTGVDATSELFYCLHGSGWSQVGDSRIRWEGGDFVTLPAGGDATHHAEQDALFYWVHDGPLLRYLGVSATEQRFRPTVFPKDRALEELAKVAADPAAKDRSRVSVLLGNKAQDQTLTVTHTLWAMFGILPRDKVQPPHRHQSVALDLILDCEPGCYTLLGESLDAEGNLVNPVRVDWEPGCAFVTPPGRWHSHHNESGANAHLIPIQDAGLQTYLRALDIQFTPSRTDADEAAQTSADISPSNVGV